MTLSENQVCQNCNGVFSKELETEIADDSFEALLRITNSIKKFSPGHNIHDTRIKLKGQDGVLKGLDFQVIADSTSAEKIQLLPYPAIGIKISENPLEYKYYRLMIFRSTQKNLGTRFLAKEFYSLLEYG